MLWISKAKLWFRLISEREILKMTASLYLDQQRAVPVWQGPTRREHPVTSLEGEEWISRALCRQGDPDALFVQGAQQRRAAAICGHCPTRTQCLASALDNREEFGVWGGLTERQRRVVLRKNTHVENWAEYLAAGGEIKGL